MQKRRRSGRRRSQPQPSISHARGAKPDPMDHISRAMERREQHSCGKDREDVSERAGHDWKQAPAKHRLLKNRTEKETWDDESTCRNSRHNLMAEVGKERHGESRCCAGKRCQSCENVWIVLCVRIRHLVTYICIDIIIYRANYLFKETKATFVGTQTREQPEKAHLEIARFRRPDQSAGTKSYRGTWRPHECEGCERAASPLA
jgi:hypothetical protein